MKKIEKGKIKNSSLYKSETILYKIWCGLMWCETNAEKNTIKYTKKTYIYIYVYICILYIHECVYMFLIFFSMITRYIATFCDLKKKRKSSLYFSVFPLSIVHELL